MVLPIVWREKANSEQYEEARTGRLFNSVDPKRYPIAIVEATEEGHVVEAVKLANEKKCRVSVRSGGHSWASWSVRDDAILLDLGGFRQIDVDETNLIVSASPSITGAELNDILVKKGLMFAGGHCPDVGLGGFLLQGGMGWVCRTWGWACEQIVAVDVVTATGKSLRCDSTFGSDLFWAARGAGPGFPAIVTRFHLRVRKCFSHMRSSAFIYPISHYRQVMDWVLKIAPSYDGNTEIVAVSVTPAGMSERCIVPLFLTFQNSESDANAALEHANRSRPEGYITEVINKPTSLASEYCDQANANPPGYRFAAENAYIKNEADVVAVLEKAFTESLNRESFALYFAMSPCSRRPLPDMALSMQTDHYFALYSIWKSERDDIACKRWIRDVMVGMEPHAAGAYLGDADFQVRKAKYWTDESAEKLMKIRREWDPHGVICGYLDVGDKSGVAGLSNFPEWCEDAS